MKDKYNITKDQNIFLAKTWKPEIPDENKIMIQNGKGVISIPVDEDIAFGEKLIKYYETNDMTVLKQFIYDKCINGIEFSNT